jgi:hypothetical protein
MHSKLEDFLLNEKSRLESEYAGFTGLPNYGDGLI